MIVRNTLNALHNREYGSARPALKDCLISSLANFSSLSIHEDCCPVFCCRFCPSENSNHILATCNESGFLSLYNTNLEDDNENILLKLSGDRRAVLWDSMTSSKLSEFAEHSQSIKAVSVCPDDPNVFATGGRDGKICLFDIRNRVKTSQGYIPAPLNFVIRSALLILGYFKPVNVINNAHYDSSCSSHSTPRKKPRISSARSESKNNPVTALNFFDKTNLISGACTETQIRWWDLRKTYSFLKCTPTPSRKLSTFGGKKISSENQNYPSPMSPSLSRKCGFSNFCTDRDRTWLFAACTDNNLYQYSLNSSFDGPICVYKGALIRSFYVRCVVSPTLPYVLCGSNDGRAYGWTLNTGNDLGKMTPPSANPLFYLQNDRIESQNEITTLAMNNRSTITTFSDDFRWRWWKMRFLSSEEEKASSDFQRLELIAKKI
uniref:Uncharacterized protein n=1 Tax=Romanomermis culicivorax TaxID=13658 RepID=A0A915K2P5_ROMCU